MSDFAKLYRADDVGQILVTLDTGDDGPAVKFSFKPQELGVCAVSLTFEKRPDEEQWEAAKRAFAKVDEELALKTVRETLIKLDLNNMCF